MIGVVKRHARALAAVACVAGAVVAGASAFGQGSPPGPGRAAATGTAVEPFSFHADAGAVAVPVLELGGLTIRGSCVDYGSGRVYLTATAETAVDDAVARVAFTRRADPQPVSYKFVNSDFDRDYGRWDFLGTNPDETSGTLGFSRPDGGQVAVDFAADEGTAEDDCVLDGTATYGPAAPESQAAPLAVSDAYLGVSCPGAPNSIACDRVALFVSTEDRPEYLLATIAGHRFRLEDAGWHRPGSAAGFEGALQVPGLLHQGRLAVAADAGDRWLGAPPVTSPIRLEGVYGDGISRERLLERVPLAAGYG